MGAKICAPKICAKNRFEHSVCLEDGSQKKKHKQNLRQTCAKPQPQIRKNGQKTEKNGTEKTKKTENSEKGPKETKSVCFSSVLAAGGALRKDSAEMKKILRKQCGNYAEGRCSSAGRSPLHGAQRMKCGHRSLVTSKHSCLHRGGLPESSFAGVLDRFAAGPSQSESGMV